MRSETPLFGPADPAVEVSVEQQQPVELSALPPGVETLLPPPTLELVEAHAPAPKVEQAMREPSTFEPRPARRPRATMAVVGVLVVLGLGATVALWARDPGFFLGHPGRGTGAAIDAPPAGLR